MQKQISVLDSTTGLPLELATFYIDGKAVGKTNGDGYIILDIPESAKTVGASFAEYNSVTLPVTDVVDYIALRPTNSTVKDIVINAKSFTRKTNLIVIIIVAIAALVAGYFLFKKKIIKL